MKWLWLLTLGLLCLWHPFQAYGDEFNLQGQTDYEILGLPEDASPEAIKKAYRKGALQFYPERPGGDEASFKIIDGAYSRLIGQDPPKPGERPLNGKYKAFVLKYCLGMTCLFNPSRIPFLYEYAQKLEGTAAAGDFYSLRELMSFNIPERYSMIPIALVMATSSRELDQFVIELIQRNNRLLWSDLRTRFFPEKKVGGALAAAKAFLLIVDLPEVSAFLDQVWSEDDILAQRSFFEDQLQQGNTRIGTALARKLSTAGSTQSLDLFRLALTHVITPTHLLLTFMQAWRFSTYVPHRDDLLKITLEHLDITKLPVTDLTISAQFLGVQDNRFLAELILLKNDLAFLSKFSTSDNTPFKDPEELPPLRQLAASALPLKDEHTRMQFLLTRVSDRSRDFYLTHLAQPTIPLPLFPYCNPN